MYCLRVNVYCHRVTTQLQLINISYHIISYLHRLVGVEFYTYLPMKIEHTERSETSAYKIKTQGNYPEESINYIIIIIITIIM
jgi:hypothetical protein